MTAETIAEQKILDQILESQKGNQSWQLPPLKADPSPLAEYWERFARWIETFFPKSSIDQGMMKQTIYLLYNLLKIAACVTAVILIVWIVAKLLELRFAKAQPARPKRRHPFTPDDDLEKLLDDAEQSGNLPLAARLYWKIFLKNVNQSKALTPHEFNLQFPRSIPDVDLAYQLMFAPGGLAAPDFKRWKRGLLSSPLLGSDGERAAGPKEPRSTPK